jgi:hypothetical protein
MKIEGGAAEESGVAAEGVWGRGVRAVAKGGRARGAWRRRREGEGAKGEAGGGGEGRAGRWSGC